MRKSALFGIIFLSLILAFSSADAGFYDDNDFDGSDLIEFSAAFGSVSGSPSYNSDADFVDDGDVDRVDLRAFAASFGKTDCTLPEASGEIGPAGGTVEVLEPTSPIRGAKIDIPANALSDIEIITISIAQMPAELPGGYFAAGECIEFGPHGRDFMNPIKLVLPYFDDDNDNLLDGTSAIELYVGAKYFNTTTQMWQEIEVENRKPDLNVLQVLTYHLSPYLPYGVCNGLPFQIDQVNDIAGKYSADCGAPPIGLASKFQSFVPSISPLAAVNLRLRAGGDFPPTGYDTTVNVRLYNPFGPVLGTTTAHVPGPQTPGRQLEVRYDFSPAIPLIPGDPYLIEWISPVEGGRILSWMAADVDSYPGGTAFGCFGDALPEVDFIFTTYAVEPLPIEKELAYLDLMNNFRIAGITKLNEDQKELVQYFIKQLEYQSACDWEDLHRSEVTSLSLDELKLVWLRRLAVAFYHEVNDSFPWRIVDYSYNHLNVLLGFHLQSLNLSFLDPENYGSDFDNITPDGYYFRNGVWSANPLHSMVVMHIVRDLYGPAEPQAALFKFVDYLRELGWYHGNKDLPEWQVLPHHVCTTPTGISVKVWNFESYFMINQGGGCSSASGVIREAMRAFNIPAIVGTNLYSHQGVFVPGLEQIMVHGDDIYTYTFRYFPAQDTFRTLEWYEPFVGQDLCDFFYAHYKKAYLDWFSYYQDPVYSPRLEFEFCNSYKAQQGYFYEAMTEPYSSTSTVCSWILGDDPDIQDGLQTLDATYSCDN